uniref:Uncharacterized protein n=1 Tax=Magallana gigas TaxID=29159 RepID=A0A8W8K894_MAGGI
MVDDLNRRRCHANVMFITKADAVKFIKLRKTVEHMDLALLGTVRSSHGDHGVVVPVCVGIKNRAENVCSVVVKMFIHTILRIV